jgi:quinol monooxygenase YgiN
MRAVYIVAIEVDPAAEERWYRWEIEEHIPEVMKEPGFLEASFYRVDRADGVWPLYEIHYLLDSRASLDAYLGGEAVQRLRADAMAKYGNVMRITRRLMDERERLTARR